MFGYIYKTTLLTTNKFYVGRHKADTFEPFRYLGSGPSFKAALKELKDSAYLENRNWHDYVKYELLEECATPEQLTSRELFWIDYLDARNPEIGYNVKYCSNIGTTGYSHTEEAKKKMSVAKKGKSLNLSDGQRYARSLQSRGHKMSDESKAKLRAINLGRKASEETRQKLREAHVRNPRNFDEEYRRKLRESRAEALATGRWSISEEGMAHLRESGSRSKSAEHRKHISETKKLNGDAVGAKNPRAKKLYCPETDTVYSWAGEAAEVLGLSVHSIRQCRQGRLVQVKGYHFVDYSD